MNLEVLHCAPTGGRAADDGGRFPIPLLFIHGSYCAAWVWQEHFLPYFAGQGFDAYALSLRGHGASEGRDVLKKARIRDFISDVDQAIAIMPRKPVIIGHSLGGGIVEKYLEQHADAPAGVLMAPAPYSGIFTSAIHMLHADPSPFFRAIRQRNFMVLSSAVTRAHMMASVSLELRTTYLARLEQVESVRAIMDLEFNKADPRKIHAPLLLLGGSSDQMVYPWQVEQTGKVFGIKPRFFTGMGHEMMLEPDWQQVADTIIAWLRAIYIK